MSLENKVSSNIKLSPKSFALAGGIMLGSFLSPVYANDSYNSQTQTPQYPTCEYLIQNPQYVGDRCTLSSGQVVPIVRTNTNSQGNLIQEYIAQVESQVPWGRNRN
ncbi:MAG: hypothetical protein LAT82_01690 [Nanoarchaeota archaeon]|nr:hypothetical protein [Nanoarchaeota archaeon]